MKPKSIIFLISFILFYMFFTYGCTIPSESYKTIPESKNKELEIFDFEKKVTGLNSFCIEIDRLEKKYNEINQDARLNFSNAGLHSEQITYAAQLRDNYQLWIEELSKIHLCSCVTGAYDHYISCIMQKHTAMCCHIKKDQWGYDKANIKDSIEYDRTRKEILNLMKILNSEAKELDLPLPYPDYSLASYTNS